MNWKKIDSYLPLATIFGYAPVNWSACALGNLLLRPRLEHDFVVGCHWLQRGLDVVQCIEDLLLVVHILGWLGVVENNVNFGEGLVFLWRLQFWLIQDYCLGLHHARFIICDPTLNYLVGRLAKVFGVIVELSLVGNGHVQSWLDCVHGDAVSLTAKSVGVAGLLRRCFFFLLSQIVLYVSVGKWLRDLLGL